MGVPLIELPGCMDTGEEAAPAEMISWNLWTRSGSGTEDTAIGESAKLKSLLRGYAEGAHAVQEMTHQLT